MRLGLVVPKKVLSHAVDRNRIKRLARSYFRLRQHDLPCLDYVFIAKGKIGDMDNASIFQLTEKLCAGPMLPEILFPGSAQSARFTHGKCLENVTT